MAIFEEYANRYRHLRLERDAQGIVAVTLHTDDGPFVATPAARRELAAACLELANDPDNRVMLLTGTGDRFTVADPESASTLSVDALGQAAGEGEGLLIHFLEIGIPIVVAVNGPARVLTELIPLGHVILLADTATLQDATHLLRGLPPTDGGQIVWPEVLGVVRGKYYLLTGQELSAPEALALGAANEVLPPTQLLPRAWEHARKLAALPSITLRNTHEVLTQGLRRRIYQDAGSGLALGSLAALAAAESSPPARPVPAAPAYFTKYDWMKMERDDQGILLITVHTNGGPLSWGADSFASHRNFADLAADPDNRVIIITGTGDTFCTNPTLQDILPFFSELTPAGMDVFFRNGPRSLDKQFQVPVPIIWAVNGPAAVHEEFFMSADLVLAAENATFQDGNHVAVGFSVAGTPTFWEEYLRPVRSKYFLLTGQELSARQALEFGVASEVVPRAQLLPRAYEHARRLAALPLSTLRATRTAFNQRLRRYALDEVRMTGALFSIANLDMGGPLAEHPHPELPPLVVTSAS